VDLRHRGSLGPVRKGSSQFWRSVRSSEVRKGVPENEGIILKEQEEGGEANEGSGKY
jgi:hypothetical protein